MKILLIHASAGAGHTKAAEAVYNHLKETTKHKLIFVDALDYTSPFYKKLYQKTYTYMITRAAWAWGFFFAATDIVCLRWLVVLLRRFFNSINAKKLEEFLKKEQFDFIVTSHFFPNEVAAHLKRQKAITSSLICVVTDYDVHSIWLSQGVDFYTAACDYTKEKLIHLGAVKNQIIVTGIPTDKKFAKEKDLKALKQRLELKDGIFTILIATGSFGIGPIEEIARALLNCQVLVVCGRNKRLYEKLNRQHFSQTKIYGHVDNMHELMAVSDCMVTKPGGLSISEALVSRLPLIFFNAIPGQEENNVRVLKDNQIGINSLGHVDVIVEEVKKMMRSPNYYAHVKDRVAKLARPSAVDNIAKLIS